MVDTNVPVVANGGPGTNATVDCQLAAIEFLKRLLDRGRIILDLAGAIQEEYHGHLNPRGQPGFGDRFYLEVLHSGPLRVERIELPIDPATGEYVDFPSDPALEQFDQADRKFAAAARRSGASVANAVDTDWHDYEAPLRANGISVEFVCGSDPAQWIERD